MAGCNIKAVQQGFRTVCRPPAHQIIVHVIILSLSVKAGSCCNTARNSSALHPRPGQQFLPRADLSGAMRIQAGINHPTLEQARILMKRRCVPVVVEVILERIANIAMGTGIDAINKFQ